MNLCFDEITSAEKAKKQFEEMLISLIMETGNSRRQAEALRKKAAEEYRAKQLQQSIAENCP